ncbi:hypothetical protein RJ639_015769 [Escallonia herrerae]|uniref:CCHC-type domain-containing protein n=1 Tax=Escallonia herrerae TaxID=1293975 RepID=A0AA89AM46_9ASTE|nr:hypothetical protein RJ639_015769 [Escallonia herrerae]
MTHLQTTPDLDTLITKTNQLHCEEPIELEEDDTNANREYSLMLLAKLISTKKPNIKIVQNILAKVWNPSKGMKVQTLEENTFCIALNHEWDRSRILESRPWSVMSSHLVVRDWPPNLSLKEIEFNISPFWIRINGLPPNQMTKVNAERIAGKIGNLKEIDFTSNGKISWLKYLRIRVEIDIHKPLYTGFSRRSDTQNRAWIGLQYERLPDFCFNCGRLGHVLRTCSHPPLTSQAHPKSPFGPWLRAESLEPIPGDAEWNPIPGPDGNRMKSKAICGNSESEEQTQNPLISSGETPTCLDDRNPLKNINHHCPPTLTSNLSPLTEEKHHFATTPQTYRNSLFSNRGLKHWLAPRTTMIVQAWNVRGLGRASRVRALKKDARTLNSDILFLSETLTPPSKIIPVLHSIGFYNHCFFPPSGTKRLAGGLCLAWKNGVDLEITNKNCNLINALIFSDPPNSPWMLTAVYGPPHWGTKRKFWDDLDMLAQTFRGPWVCFGDFNAISNQMEKKGGRPVHSSSSGSINGFIDNNQLVDLGFSGNPFTWSNNRPLAANIKERLDKAYANIQWRSLFPDASVLHLPGKSSDHLPIAIKTHKSNHPGPKPFRFESAWTRDPSSHHVVNSSWRIPAGGGPMKVLQEKTEFTSKNLKKWNVNHFGNIQSKIKLLTRQLDSVQQREPTIRNLELEANIKAELDEQCKREEWLWHQKSRITWRTEGDLNTRFFHLSILIRRRKNAIDLIKDKEGNWISSREEIGP